MIILNSIERSVLMHLIALTNGDRGKVMTRALSSITGMCFPSLRQALSDLSAKYCIDCYEIGPNMHFRILKRPPEHPRNKTGEMGKITNKRHL